MNKKSFIETILQNHPNKALGFYEYRFSESQKSFIIWSTNVVCGEFNSCDIIVALASVGVSGTLSYSVTNNRVELSIHL